ncbi:c-type cytochrome [Campylobacter sp. CCUG 57310]|uniref:c-type cytochrome n=1 Tax=Campylobacter sp. CCUG 57310 TaxID=2517362 RepID=UPI001565AFBF|nr:c-type cytochrome [Campylobacter sp. CCUG 57310]QKF91688.1 periplasmic monoheme cytochrome c553 [Campylobacter sp. CCUG 57310]
MKKLLIVSGATALLASSLFAADGATLYKKCVACHGPKAEKSFLNKVPALTTFSKEEMVEALKAYKAGTLNKFNSAAMMKPIVAPMSEADMEAVSEYITTLKK